MMYKHPFSFMNGVFFRVYKTLHKSGEIMDFIIGALSGLGIVAIMSATYYIGYRTGLKHKTEPLELDEQEKRRAKEFHEGFQALMNYDVAQAMQRKKVT